MNTPDRKSDLIYISKILPRVMNEIKRPAELRAVKDMQKIVDANEKLVKKLKDAKD